MKTLEFNTAKEGGAGVSACSLGGASRLTAGAPGITGQYTSLDIHKALFGNNPPEQKALADLKEAIRIYTRRKHANPQ
jgi:hypothetical protein